MTAGHEGILIQIQNLSKGFEGRPVLRHLTASFPSGRIIGLLGTNGIGKTTLLSMIGGLSVFPRQRRHPVLPGFF